MSIFDETLLNNNIRCYLNDEINNPILKKVVEEEFIYSSNLSNILNKYFSDVIKSDNFNDKFNSLYTLIKNVSKDNYNHLRDQLTNAFVNLDAEEHISLIINITPVTENIFGIMNNNPTTSNILKNILSGLCIGTNDEYIIKCIESCKIINKSISDSIVTEYILNNGCDIVMNDKLLSYFMKYISDSLYNENNIHDSMVPLINIKLTSIMSNLNTLSIINMSFAFEIYKIGKIIIDSCLKFNRFHLWSKDIMVFSNEQLEYIAKSVHTCMMNKNISQAQGIHAIIYFMNENQISKYTNYYNKFLQLRIKSTDNKNIISDEYTLWNINQDYKIIINSYDFSSYKQIINNIKYTISINNDMEKIRIKNSEIKMNKIKVNLVNEIDTKFENIKHHSVIVNYLDNLNKYINFKAPLQKIEHSHFTSKIKLKTKMGSIHCSLIAGSCLLYLQDSPLTIDELTLKINISKEEIQNIIDILYFNNIVISSEKTYKYVEPFGDVDCCNVTMKIKQEQNNNQQTNFTDIIITMDSRIMKEIKPMKMNIMELERRVIEFMGDSYVRNIFYQRLDSLKKKYYIKEVDSIIEYLV